MSATTTPSYKHHSRIRASAWHVLIGCLCTLALGYTSATAQASGRWTLTGIPLAVDFTTPSGWSDLQTHYSFCAARSESGWKSLGHGSHTVGNHRNGEPVTVEYDRTIAAAQVCVSHQFSKNESDKVRESFAELVRHDGQTVEESAGAASLSGFSGYLLQHSGEDPAYWVQDRRDWGTGLYPG